MALMPLFFSSNIIIGRGAIGAVEPFTLAFFRWSGALLILLPFAWAGMVAIRTGLSRQAKRIALLGFLGMWICGAMVYLALDYTTATNGTLIYTTSPVLILLLEAIWRGRPITLRQAVGSACAFLGVAMIVLKGNLGSAFAHDYNIGDLIFLGCALAWAVYSVLLKQEDLQQFPTMPLFAAIIAAGATSLLPFMIWESLATGRFPMTADAWLSIAGLVFFSSILSYSSYQYGVKRFGPSLTGMMLYLLPAYGVVLAILFLGETLRPYHMIGLALILPGVVLATLPDSMIRRLRARAPNT
jgi:drug/metabolite transporter (DMT)-like permease